MCFAVVVMSFIFRFMSGIFVAFYSDVMLCVIMWCVSMFHMF